MHRLIPVAAAVLAGALGFLSFVENIELDTYDRRVAATARPSAPDDDIVIVWINDDSLRRMEPIVGRWPWPRMTHAMVIDYLATAGAKVIVTDVAASNGVIHAIDTVLIAVELATVRDTAPLDEETGLDAALAALTGKVTLGDGVGRPVEAVIGDIWRRAGEELGKG